jgi:hypothetical protein
MKLDVNTDSAIQLTAKLEKLHRSGFPSAVRNTLNDLAFETKKQIPLQAKNEFTIRQKNLFNKFSVVQKATGFNVNSMSSKVGIDASQFPNVAEGLAKQETGGNIQGSKLIPHDKGRISGSYQKKLKTKNRLSSIKIATRRNRVKGAKFVLLKKGSNGTVFEINNGKLSPVFIYQQSRNKKIKKRSYIAPSVKIAVSKTEMLYQKNANFQIKKYLK